MSAVQMREEPEAKEADKKNATKGYNNPLPQSYWHVNKINGSRGAVAGEKQWQSWAGQLNEYGDKAVNASNTRLPYASTLQVAKIEGKLPKQTQPAFKSAL